MSLHVDIGVNRGTFSLAARFEAPMPGVTAVFGPSGAGKSLLLSAIAGLARPISGRVILAGRVLSSASAEDRVFTPPHLRDVGLAFQDARLFPHLTVRGNLAYAAQRAPAGPGFGLDEAADQFGVAALLDRPVRNLSGGEKSRVALARALLSKPRLLLLDEPFAALDGARRRAFIRLILEAAERLSLPMLVVTHQIDDVAEMADHVVTIAAGHAEGAPAEQAMSSPAFLRLLDVRDYGARVPLQQLGAAGPGRAAWVRADTVVLAASRPEGLSARHIWSGALSELRREADGSVLATLRLDKGYILSRITAEAAAELGFAIGRPAWAVVKAHAI